MSMIILIIDLSLLPVVCLKYLRSVFSNMYLTSFVVMTLLLRYNQVSLLVTLHHINLNNLYDYIAQAMDRGKEVRPVFCDISKAFDRVWHNGLLHKLWSTGIRGSLFKWFESYSNNRKQFTVINSYKSIIKSIKSGQF